MRYSTIAVAAVLLIGACASNPASQPEPEPEPEAAPPQPEPAAAASAEVEASGLMEPSQIKEGVDKLNPGVLACGEQFGLSSGTRIPVRFVIEGSTGAIAEFEVLQPADAGLVSCVQKVLVDAGPGVFPSFAADEQHFQFNFRMR